MTTSRATTALLFATASLLAAPTYATEILPGQTIAVSSLSPATFSFADVSATAFGYLDYQEPNVGTRASYTYYSSLYSNVLVDAAGNQQLLYRFGDPEFGSLPPTPNDPLKSINDLPSDTVISVSGFGTGPVDLSAFPSQDALSAFPGAVFPPRLIQRSASGDVLTMTNFSTAKPMSFAQPNLGLLIDVPGKSFARSNATVTLTDLEGNPRTLDAYVLAPIPEPSGIALLPLAIASLAFRLHRRPTA